MKNSRRNQLKKAREEAKKAGKKPKLSRYAAKQAKETKAVSHG